MVMDHYCFCQNVSIWCSVNEFVMIRFVAADTTVLIMMCMRTRADGSAEEAFVAAIRWFNIKYDRLPFAPPLERKERKFVIPWWGGAAMQGGNRCMCFGFPNSSMHGGGRAYLPLRAEVTFIDFTFCMADVPSRSAFELDHCIVSACALKSRHFIRPASDLWNDICIFIGASRAWIQDRIPSIFSFTFSWIFTCTWTLTVDKKTPF